MAIAFTPYSTAAPLFGTKPSWLTSELDIQRIQAYQLYEQIYWTANDTFKITFRGSNQLPIYVPSARTIVDTVDRFTAPELGLSFVDATSARADTADALAAKLAFRDLFARERFFSKFDGNKLYGIMRGDWIWHVTANPLKPQGSRISITSLDPAMYFPITDPDDVDKLIGCHLVEQITTQQGPRIRRLTYRKTLDSNGVPTGQITVEDAIFALDQWEGPQGKPEKVLQQPTPLPPSITALPVYHVPNTDNPGDPFGSSEIRGLERIMGAVNQTISDEDLTLAMEGIGQYITDAPPPTDDQGNVIGWQLGPGRVAQVPEGNMFQRVKGADSVVPYGDHYGRLLDALMTASALSDVAVGRVANQALASGVALAIQLKPLLSKAGKKNTLITEVHNQMLFDLMTGWMPAYESTSFDNVLGQFTVGDPVPTDRAEKMSELNDMLDRGVIDTQYYRDEMTKLGYEFPPDIAARITAEQNSKAQTTATGLGLNVPDTTGGTTG